MKTGTTFTFTGTKNESEKIDKLAGEIKERYDKNVINSPTMMICEDCDEKDSNQQEYNSDVQHIVWSYRWKWFRPPMWWVFHWAFCFTKTTYKGCYPIAIESETPNPVIRITDSTQLKLVFGEPKSIIKEEGSNVKVSE